jgi:hypothetical protein
MIPTNSLDVGKGLSFFEIEQSLADVIVLFQLSRPGLANLCSLRVEVEIKTQVYEFFDLILRFKRHSYDCLPVNLRSRKGKNLF